MQPALSLTQRRFADLADPNPDGSRDYAYTGTIYEFRLNNRLCLVRRYDDTPEQAAILILRPRRIDRLCGRLTRRHDPLLTSTLVHLLALQDPEFSTPIRIVKRLTRAGYVLLRS